MSELAPLSIEERDGVVVARVTGELDIAGTANTGERISQAVAPTAVGVVVDFSELEFIDSSGVAMLFALARRLDGREVAVTVRDFGVWRPPRDGDQGRGLSLMRALMDSVEVAPSPDGTTVHLRRVLNGDGREDVP